MSLDPTARAPRVLVVDDEPSILEMLRLRLESMGARVTTLAGGSRAVEVARQESPDLILLDVMMPDLDGFSVIQALKADETVQDIPVIFMTARDEVESRVQGLDMGAHDYVGKPFNTTELVARVRAALRVKTQQDDLRAQNRELGQLATSDPLTGLPNRRVFDEQVFLEVERARRTGRPLSCLIFDIDDFKDVNDRYGHQTGDEVLRRIGRILLHRRRGADMVARYGGEEFVWLLPGADGPDAVELGEWLLRTLADEAIEASTGRVSTSVTIGISTYRPEEHGDVPTTLLLAYADRALLEAKAAGKARVHFRELVPDEVLADGGTAEEMAEPDGAGRMDPLGRF